MLSFQPFGGDVWELSGPAPAPFDLCGSFFIPICGWLAPDPTTGDSSYYSSSGHFVHPGISSANWRKAELDREVSWIGWTLNFSTGIIKLQSTKRDKLLKLIDDLLQRPKTSRKQIEKFIGLLLWVTQIFLMMRSFIHHLYADLYKAPATLYSVDPGYWLTTVACLSETLQFSVRPIGTAIPIGGQLLSVRHQPVQSLEDVRNCRSGCVFWIQLHPKDLLVQVLREFCVCIKTG